MTPETLLEYGVLGLAVGALSLIVWRFVLLRLSSENDSLKTEMTDLQRRHDSLLQESVSDLKDACNGYAQNAAKSRAAVTSATEVMHLVLRKLEDENEPGTGS